MRYRLGDICTIIKGETGIMKAIPGPYTMIALGETDKTHNEFQFDTKAVIIPLVSSTGHGHASMKRVKYCEGKFALGNILCAVIPKDENFVLAKYLHIYLHWNREELLVSQMKGMANVSLPMNRIADVMATVPSIEKQREIIELEKQLVKKEIEADKLFADQLSQLDNLNQAILQEAVQGKLVPQDPKDEPASELLKRIKLNRVGFQPNPDENNIGLKPTQSAMNRTGFKPRPMKELPPIKPEEIPFEIPSTWVWCRLGEIGESTIGIIFKPSQVGKIGIPVLRANNVQNGKIDYADLILVNTEVREKQIANIGDILLCVRSGSNNLIGKAAMIEKEGMSFGAFMSLYRSKFNSYILKFMHSDIFKKQINDKKSTGINQLTQGTLNNIMIPLPPLSEQKRIVEEIEKQFAKTKQLKENIIANQQATEQLLKALLHQAFEVSEIEEANPIGKIIELPILQVKEESHFAKRKVLATYIINQSLDDQQFGDVKFEKLLHLSDYFAIKRNLGQNYYQQVAGPLDNSFTIPFFEQIEKSKWFNRKKIGRQFQFSKAENHSKSLNTYSYFSDEELAKVQKLIDYFKKTNYEKPEIISTLYAVWNNRIIKQQPITDDIIKQDFLEWDKNKAKYKDSLDGALAWMRKEGVVPDGWGKVIEKPKTKKKK